MDSCTLKRKISSSCVGLEMRMRGDEKSNMTFRWLPFVKIGKNMSEE